MTIGIFVSPLLESGIRKKAFGDFLHNKTKVCLHTLVSSSGADHVGVSDFFLNDRQKLLTVFANEDYSTISVMGISHFPELEA